MNRKVLNLIIGIFLIGWIACGLIVGVAMYLETERCSWKYDTDCIFRAVPLYHGEYGTFSDEFKGKT